MNNQKHTSKIEDPKFSHTGEKDQQAQYGLLDYWEIIYRNKWGVLGLTLAGLLIGGITALTAQPIYRASATLLVAPSQPNLMGIKSLDGAPSAQFFYETQYEIIRSRLIAETVADSLKLSTRDGFLTASQYGEKSGEKSGDESSNDESWFSAEKKWLAETGQDWQSANAMEDAASIASNLRAAAVNLVQNSLTVKSGQRSQMVVVVYEHNNARLAAEVANGVAKAYAEYGLAARMITVKDATRWLSNRLVELRQQLEISESTLQSFQSRESMVDSENRSRILSARLTNLTNELLRAQNEHSEAQIRHQQINDARNTRMSDQKLVSLLDDKLIQRMYTDNVLLQRKVSELSERYGVKHPKLIAARADLEETNKAMQKRIDDAIVGVQKAYEAAAAKERETERRIAAQQNQMRTVTGKGFQLVKLERDVKANRQLYDTFLARFKEVGATSDNDLPNVRVVDAALAPTTPYKPNRKRILIISLVFGLFLGIGLALLRNRLENTFRRGADIEEKLLLPVLAEIPHLKKEKDKPVMPERYILAEPRSRFTEALNQVRTGILFSNLDTPIKTVMVTSTQSGDGKTTLASNLALSFSKMGRTLLLDADLRHPDIRRVAGMDKGLGLSDWVAGGKLNECCSADKQSPDLFVMTTGKLPPNPLELLSSNTFKKYFSLLKEHFEYVVVDTPPVLPVSDALVIGHLVDGVILTVKFDVTTFSLAQEAVKRLRHNHIEPLGAVMSMTDLDKIKKYYGSRYYGGHYGESYGEYYGKGAEQ